jgi:uncharacterized membrane protein YgaE (UPF0421/DUF939 family)
MTRKGALLFLLVCVLSGVGLFLGAMIGYVFGTPIGIHLAGIIAGIAGIVAATKIAVSRQILGPKRFWGATIGAALGLALAALVGTFHHMSSPLYLVIAVLPIGLGAVFGAASRHGKSIAD